MKNWKDKPLFAVPVKVIGEFPKCQDKLCLKRLDCANHETANEWRETFGATPNLRQIVPGSWRCQQIPEEKFYGAVLTDCTFLKDHMDLKDCTDYTDLTDFYPENNEDDKDEN